MIQTKIIKAQCQGRIKSKGRCIETATIGVFTWAGSETDVNLDKPYYVFCGRHKPKHEGRYAMRNVKLRRR